MSHWDLYRPSFLAIALGGTILAFGWGIKTPLLPRPTVAAFTFPEKIPLSRWKQISSTPLVPPNSTKIIPIASKAYQYRSSRGLILNIQMRYLNASKADIPNLLNEYTTIPSSPKISHQPGIGAIALITHKDRLYLSACINPEGPTTATADQYLRTKLTTGKNLDWFLAWLGGRANLLDQRCLWSHLSVSPRSPIETLETQKTLQAAWKDWFEWWKINFPSQDQT